MIDGFSNVIHYQDICRVQLVTSHRDTCPYHPISYNTSNSQHNYLYSAKCYYDMKYNPARSISFAYFIACL